MHKEARVQGVCPVARQITTHTHTAYLHLPSCILHPQDQAPDSINSCSLPVQSTSPCWFDRIPDAGMRDTRRGNRLEVSSELMPQPQCVVLITQCVCVCVYHSRSLLWCMTAPCGHSHLTTSCLRVFISAWKKERKKKRILRTVTLQVDMGRCHFMSGVVPSPSHSPLLFVVAWPQHSLVHHPHPSPPSSTPWTLSLSHASIFTPLACRKKRWKSLG